MVGYARSQGIYWHNEAGVPALPLPLEHRIGHGPRPAQLIHPAVKHISHPGGQGVFQIRLVEKGQMEHPRVVHRSDLHQLQPFPDPGQAGAFRHQGGHAAGLLQGGLADGPTPPPVLIPLRKVLQQVPQPLQPQPGQRPALGRADTRKLGQRRAFLQSHAPTFFPLVIDGSIVPYFAGKKQSFPVKPVWAAGMSRRPRFIPLHTVQNGNAVLAPV